MDDLDKVLKKLKKGKAADPTGLVNDLFTFEYIESVSDQCDSLNARVTKDHGTTTGHLRYAHVT